MSRDSSICRSEFCSRIMSAGSGQPGSGASGSCDQPVPPDSRISGICPVDSSTMVLIADSVPRHTYSRAAPVTSRRRRSSGISGTTATPTQPASHSTMSAGAVSGSRYEGRQSSVASTGASTSSSPWHSRCAKLSSAYSSGRVPPSGWGEGKPGTIALMSPEPGAGTTGRAHPRRCRAAAPVRPAARWQGRRGTAGPR